MIDENYKKDFFDTLSKAIGIITLCIVFATCKYCTSH